MAAQRKVSLSQREKALVTALRVAVAHARDPDAPPLKLALQALEETTDIRLDESPYATDGVVVSMAEYVLARNPRRWYPDEPAPQGPTTAY